MPRFEPIGFVVTLVDAAPQMAAPEQVANATVRTAVRRAGTRPPECADEDAPTVQLPSRELELELALAPTVVEGGWSPPATVRAD